MKKKIFTILFILVSTIVNSQTFDISGSISDSTSKQGLLYGNIVLKNHADSIIKIVLANENGEFKLRNISYKKGMYLYINYLGYVVRKIEINDLKKPKINFGKIFLQPDFKQIKVMDIIGNTTFMEQKFDRKVFNINSTKTASAKDIFDLLRTLPGVTIAEDGNVKYKGAPATIYVDDQPAEYVYPKTEMIPVESVLKIELIDASLRSVEGVGGIINIKMKTVTIDGLSGVVQANGSTITFKEFSANKEFLNVNYKIKKVIFFYNANYGYLNTYTNSTTEGELNFNSNNYLL